MKLLRLSRVAPLAILALTLGLMADAAFAQTTPAPTPTLDKGDTAWMLTSTVLVLLMIIPGLALFYGGLVRTKNMLSLLTQVLAVTCIVCIVWAVNGYSLSFTESTPFIGGTEKMFLAGITPESLSGTIPEYVFLCFQMTFACITTALVLGGVLHRKKLSASCLCAVRWPAFV
jgi:Amt family ammonium transporter